jgi:hypothetical protein
MDYCCSCVISALIVVAKVLPQVHCAAVALLVVHFLHLLSENYWQSYSRYTGTSDVSRDTTDMVLLECRCDILFYANDIVYTPGLCDSYRAWFEWAQRC